MKKRIILSVLLIAVLVAIDQFTKYLIIQNLKLYDEYSLLGNSFVLKHIHNEGAAWGSLSGKRWLLLIITAIAFFVMIYVYKNISREDRFRPLRICLIFISGGAIGNLIDRVRLGYVTDFLYFKLIDFPVFNFADICVTCAVFVVIILCIFKYRGKDLDIIIGEKEHDK